jgi:hypothetical protein
MIHDLPEINLDKISHFDNGFFYCINTSSQRIPAGLIRHVTVLPDNKIEFALSHFPVLEEAWNVFAAELHFYKKGLPFNMNLHGTAWLVNKDDLTVQFKVLYIESFGQPEIKNYSLQDTLIDFFSNTSLFFKKMILTGF